MKFIKSGVYFSCTSTPPIWTSPCQGLHSLCGQCCHPGQRPSRRKRTDISLERVVREDLSIRQLNDLKDGREITSPFSPSAQNRECVFSRLAGVLCGHLLINCQENYKETSKVSRAPLCRPLPGSSPGRASPKTLDFCLLLQSGKWLQVRFL